MASFLDNLFPNLSSGISQQMAGVKPVPTATQGLGPVGGSSPAYNATGAPNFTTTKPVPTANQIQSSKLASSLTTQNTARPGYVAPTSAAPIVKAPNDPGNKYDTSTGQLNTNYTGYVNPNPVTPPRDLGNFDQNRTAAFNAAAPVDTNTYKPALDTLANANAQLASSQAARAGYGTNYDNLLSSGSQTTSDIYNKQLTLADRILGQQSANAGLAQTGAANTLAQQMAVAQANRTQGVEQAGVPLTLNKADMQSTYGTPIYNPYNTQAGPQNTSGGSGQIAPTDPFYKTMQTYANLLSTNQGSAIPASIKDNQVLNAQLQTMAKAINPSYNVNTSAGVASGQVAQGQQVSQMTSSLQQVNNLKDQFTNLVTSQGINPADINAVNTAIQKIASNVSSPQYATFHNYIAEIASKYAEILTPAGGSPTDLTQKIGQGLLDSSMKGEGILQVMQALDQSAQAKIAGISTTGGNTGSTGQSYTAGTKNSTGELMWDGSKWVASK